MLQAICFIISSHQQYANLRLGNLVSREAFIHYTALDLDLPWAIDFHFEPHLPWLVVMVAKFFMCERKESNLIYYCLVTLYVFFKPVATGWLQNVFY